MTGRQQARLWFSTESADSGWMRSLLYLLRFYYVVIAVKAAVWQELHARQSSNIAEEVHSVKY
jgi:hypothetical protein